MINEFAEYDSTRHNLALLQKEPLSKIQRPQEKGRHNVYRVRNKYLLLTYSQIPEGFPWSTIIDDIGSLGGKCTIAKEEHPITGGHHIHVFAANDDVFTFRGERVLDVYGIHPNITPVKATPWKAWAYVRKDNHVLHDGIPSEPRGQRDRKRKGDDLQAVYTHILEGDSRAEKLRRIKDSRPQDLVRNWNNISRFVEHEHPTKREFEPYDDPEGFQSLAGDYPEIEKWCAEYLPSALQKQTCMGNSDTNSESNTTGEDIFSLDSWDPTIISDFGTDITVPDTSLTTTQDTACYEVSGKGTTGESDDTRQPMRYETPSKVTRKAGKRFKCLIIVGQSLLGKTNWARSLGRHSYFNNMFSLSEYDPDCEYAVFDDISGGLGKFPYKQWLGGQHRIGISDKYHKNFHDTWARPCIYLSNSDPFLQSPKGVDLQWLAANSVTVKLAPNKPLSITAWDKAHID